MIEVKQALDNDCLRACIASILELSIELVPHYPGESGQYDRYREWLRPFNLDFIAFAECGYQPRGYAIVGTTFEGQENAHAIVALDGEPVWDPAPGGLDGHYHITDWSVFQVLDPSQPVVLVKAEAAA